MKPYILTLLLTLLLASCSLVEEKLPPCNQEDSETVTLSFQMLTKPSNPGSRADNQHQEIGSEFTEFEDRIDVSDIALFIFAKITGEKDADGKDVPEKLIFSTHDFPGEPAVVVESLSENLFSIIILRRVLFETLGIDSDPESFEKVTFRVMMLANCNASAADWNEIKNMSTYTDVIDAINKKDVWTVMMENIYNDGSDADDVTKLYGKNGMPMFGTGTFDVAQAVLYSNHPNKRIYLGEIDMLRALAKVRVIDNIEKNTAGYPRIVSASITGTQDVALPLPAGALTYENGNQVHAINIPETPASEFVTYRLGLLSGSPSPSDDDFLESAVTRIGFVPEQKIVDDDDDVELSTPLFRLKVACYEHEGVIYYRDYVVPMFKYKDILFEFGEAVLRNHIYTLSVSDLDDVDLICQVDVLPYRGVELNPGFGFNDPTPRPPVQPGETPPWVEFPDPDTPQD